MAEQGNKQATWGGRFRQPPSPLMAAFSESVSFDKELAPFDIAGSQAHAKMLASVGLITDEERDALVSGLESILKDVKAGRFEWKEQFEDVHMNIEQELGNRIPEAIAGKLHTARSRNDQVALDMRLYLRDACAKILQDINALMKVLVELADKNKDVLIPGYTHVQRAQPVSVAHHLLAYVEMFSRDSARFSLVFDEAGVSPLGSGAIAGSTLPIDRGFVARELGLVDDTGEPLITMNSMDAVADRDGFIDFTHACALCGVHMSRVAEDMILWNSTEFGYIFLPDAYTTGSSLMPQKKNPDSMELIRGKSARIQGDLHTLYTMVKGLPLTYNRDLQEDKPPVFDACRQTSACLQVLAGALGHKDTHMMRERCAAAVSDPLLLATDLADYLVTKSVPFRKAHHIVGEMVALAEATKTPLDKLADKDVKKLSPAFGKDWRKVFDLKRAMNAREKPGMPGPRQVAKRIAYWRSALM
jgi:argininosuccinate lyase